MIFIAVMASPIVSCVMACLAIAMYILHERVYRQHGAGNGNARDSPQTDSKVRPPPYPADHAEPEEKDGNKMKTFRISLHDEPITQQKQAEGIHLPHSPSVPPDTSIHGHPAAKIYIPVERPRPREEMTLYPQALSHEKEAESHTTKNQDRPKKSQSQKQLLNEIKCLRVASSSIRMEMANMINILLGQEEEMMRVDSNEDE